MQATSQRESIKVGTGELVEHFKRVVHEGNVRRIVIRQGDDIVVEFPLTVAVVGALIAPILAAVGAIAAFLTDCTMDVERTDAEEGQANASIPPASEAAEAKDLEDWMRY